MRAIATCLGPGLLLALTMTGCASRAVALDRLLLGYDHTVVDGVSKLLLLNIARAHLDRPMHFTTISSIAATFDFRFNAGVGPAATGELGYLPMPTLGGSAAESPTITITPMQGDEFTKRLLLPFDEQKVAALLHQDYDIDALLRLIASELRVREGDREVVNHNLPADRKGYERFRRAVAHLSSVQDRRYLHADALQFRMTRTVPAANVSSEELRNYYDDPSLVYDAEKNVYRIDAPMAGRVVITNYSTALLPNQERIALHEEARKNPPSDVLVDIRPKYPGGEFPIHGTLRMRSFLNVLTFIGRGIQAEPEYDVAPDRRTPPVSENPARTLEVIEGRRAPVGTDFSIELAGRTYSLRPDKGYRWNKKAFALLYQLYQMSVAPAPSLSPLITIGK